MTMPKFCEDTSFGGIVAHPCFRSGTYSLGPELRGDIDICPAVPEGVYDRTDDYGKFL